jgi:hypothetical protein
MACASLLLLVARTVQECCQPVCVALAGLFSEVCCDCCYRLLCQLRIPGSRLRHLQHNSTMLCYLMIVNMSWESLAQHQMVVVQVSPLAAAAAAAGSAGCVAAVVTAACSSTHLWGTQACQLCFSATQVDLKDLEVLKPVLEDAIET